LKFQATAEKTAKNLRGLLFLPHTVDRQRSYTQDLLSAIIYSAGCGHDLCPQSVLSLWDDSLTNKIAGRQFTYWMICSQSTDFEFLNTTFAAVM